MTRRKVPRRRGDVSSRGSASASEEHGLAPPPPLPPPPLVPAEAIPGPERRRYASARAKAVADALESEFDRLKAAKDAHRRGSEFESLLARLFHMNNFDVVRSAKSAPGRQVDLTATSPSLQLLVEAKWKRRNIDVADMASLADRLGQASPGPIGLFVSMSGYAEAARNRALDAKRSIASGRMMILLERGDVEDLFSGRAELRPLLERRLELLRFHDRTHEPGEGTERCRQPIPLPGADIRPLELGRSPLASAAYDIVFVDTGWYARNTDVSYVLDLPLLVRRGTLDDVRDVLEIVHASLVIGDGGGFTVTQLGPPPWTWHGSGVEPLLQCLGTQAERYRRAKVTTPHHSEEFALVVPFEDGWLALSGRQSTLHHRRPSVRELHLELRLPYLPLDMDGIATLARRLDMRGIGLSTLNRPLVERVSLQPAPVVAPCYHGTSDLFGERYITRSVVTNPWQDNPRACPSPNGGEHAWAGELAASSFIEGTLGHALAVTERVPRFSITSVDSIQFTRVTAIHAHLDYALDEVVRVQASRRAEKGRHGKSRS